MYHLEQAGTNSGHNQSSKTGLKTYLSIQPSSACSCLVAIRGLMGRRSDAAFPALSTISLMQPMKDSMMYLTPCNFSSGLRPESRTQVLQFESQIHIYKSSSGNYPRCLPWLSTNKYYKNRFHLSLPFRKIVRLTLQIFLISVPFFNILENKRKRFHYDTSAQGHIQDFDQRGGPRMHQGFQRGHK